jgi:hypothetical protein
VAPTVPLWGPEKPLAVITPAAIVTPELFCKTLPVVPLNVGMAVSVLDAGPFIPTISKSEPFQKHTASTFTGIVTPVVADPLRTMAPSELFFTK